jgi:3-hydroxyisobutyrate dehydrogenase-like beta-hydroxyacid dehydrogenase
MGGGIASTLLRNLHEVVVRDIDSARVERLVRAGGVAASNMGELVEKTDAVILSLPSSHATVSVIENEILPVARAGTVVIDMGTTVVRETRRLHDELAAKGAHLIDSPVSGGSAGAAAGELYCFVGGDREIVSAWLPVIGTLGGGRTTYCGATGSGQIVKAVNQLIMGLVSAAHVESLAFGVAAGVDPAVLHRALGGSGGFRATLSPYAGRIVDGQGDSFDHKFAEFDYFVDEANQSGFAAPILRALSDYMGKYPRTCSDNMDRPYPPFYSALVGEAEEEET